MPFLLAEILNFQCALHLKGVGSLSNIFKHIFESDFTNDRYSLGSLDVNV